MRALLNPFNSQSPGVCGRRVAVRISAFSALILGVSSWSALGQGPVPTASVNPASVPAMGRQQAILKTSAFGRFAVTVKSAQGVGLQLVDRMAGPGQSVGQASAEDGRLDLLLDRGEYKIITTGHERATGKAELTVRPFIERNLPQAPLLVELKPVLAELGDFEQLSYWLHVEEQRTVILETAGRHLTDLRLWQDGVWLVDASPTKEVVEPTRGQPLLVCRLVTKLNPGWYLLTAYGGVGQPWAKGGKERPFHLRFGIPVLSETGRQRFEVGPFGFDRYLVPANANYYRLELPEARAAKIDVALFDPEKPFDNEGDEGTIDKKSLPPVCEVEVGVQKDKQYLVTVRADAGQPYVLQHFNISWEYKFSKSGEYWISSIHSGFPADSIDATAIVARWRIYGGLEKEPFLTKVIELDSTHGFARRCNLLDELTVFVFIKSTGKYQVASKGVAAKFRIEPFFVYRPANYSTPEARPSGSVFDLDSGYYILTVIPEKKGILDLVIKPTGLVGQALEMIGMGGGKTEQTPIQAAAQFPQVSLSSNYYYVAFGNRQPGVKVGWVLRSLPIDLREALPLHQREGEDIEVDVTVAEKSTLAARTEDGALLEISVDGSGGQKAPVVEAGKYHLKISSQNDKTIFYSLSAAPVRLQDSSPLPPLPVGTLEGLPKFPVLTAGQPQVLDLERNSASTFLVKADEPALYRLESTGLLETMGVVRTRIVTSLDSKSSNGTGRNFLIQQYLREGDYQLTVSSAGQSAGHLGVRLAKTPFIDGGSLTEEVPTRITLAAGQGVAYTFRIKEKGEYNLRALGLGRTFRCRLEDGEGWPILAPNIEANISREFEAGTYRLVLLPEGVPSRRLTLLSKVERPKQFTGRGPHKLRLAAPWEHVWKEPAAEGQERIPDVWEFNLPAPANVKIGLSAEMQGELQRVSGEGPAGKVTDIPAGRGWDGPLTSGVYRIAAQCSRRNNMVTYTVSVTPTELLAGMTRAWDGQNGIPISVGRSGLVEFSSFGDADVRARLFTESGALVTLNDDRPDDWNFLIAAQLTPGRYTLKIAAAGSSFPSCWIAMRMAEESIREAIVPPARVSIETGALTHVIHLNLASDARFLAVGVRSEETVACALEKASGGRWVTLATSLGRPAHLEVPLEGLASALRLRVWSADQQGLPAQVTVTTGNPALTSESSAEKGVSFAPLAGSDPPVLVAGVRLDHPGLFRVDEAWTGRVVARAGQNAKAVAGKSVIANGSMLWLVTDGPGSGGGKVRVKRLVLPSGSAGIIAELPVAGPMLCDLATSQTGLVLVLATSMSGQPMCRVVEASETQAVNKEKWTPGVSGLAVGRHGAVSLGLGVKNPVAVVWSGVEMSTAADIHLEQHVFRPGADQEGAFGAKSGRLAGEAAQFFRLPAGKKRVRVALTKGTVAALIGGNNVQSVHWAGVESINEQVDTDATRLVVMNPGSSEGQYTFSVLPISADLVLPTLSLDQPLEFVQSAACTLRVEIPALAGESGRGGVVHVRGMVDGAVLVTGDGRVRRGKDLPVGNAGGTLMLSTKPGRLLAWLDRDDSVGGSLWGTIAGMVTTPLTPPQVVRLAGKTQTLKINLDKPGMLHLRSATPMVTRLTRPDGGVDVMLHPESCRVDAVVPAGSVELGLRAVGGSDLAGTAEVTTSSVTSISEGLGPEVLMEGGQTRGFSFTVNTPGPVGVGVRGDSDVAVATLLDSKGKALGTGVVQMATLQPGTYTLTIHVPATSLPARVRPAVVGVSPPDVGPPPGFVRCYLQLALGKVDDCTNPDKPQAPPPVAEEDEGNPEGESVEEGEGEGEGESEGEGETEGAGEGSFAPHFYDEYSQHDYRSQL